MFLITSEQIRGARSILRWTYDDLSKKSGVSLSTLKRIENGAGFPACRFDNIEKIKTALESTNTVSFPDSDTIKIFSR